MIDILGSEHEEAIFSAKEAFKTLIDGCIDEGLIKQGVDQIIHSQSDDRKSGPTIIEKVCAIIESLLDYCYSMVWDMSFHIVSTMFDKLGIGSASCCSFLRILLNMYSFRRSKISTWFLFYRVLFFIFYEGDH